jgi:hypothetical protein
VALAALLAIGVAAGCQAQPSPSGCAGSGSPPGEAVGCEPSATPSATSTSTDPEPVPSPTLDTDAPAEIDPALLDVLPATVGGVAVAEDVDEAAIAVADPNLSRVAGAVDVGVALDEGSGNLVTAHVVRLREGLFDEAAYRDWRDSFDEGACAAGGGVKGRAEATIDDRTVFITTCVTALRVYHLWLEDEGLLVSATSLGSGDFGRLLMEGLRLE